MATVASAFQKDVQYMTSDGDVLDLICWNYYGQTTGIVEQVFLRNRPVLSTYPAIMPTGILIVLPEIDTPVAQSFQLWDYRQTQEYKAMTAQIAETEAQVQSALESYRGKRTTASVPPLLNPQVVFVGDKTRIRATDAGAVVEVLGGDGVWRKQQGWESSK